ncbi:MAG: thioredoxin fold domain-containing protein [Chitinophagales bacterium]
MRNLFIFALLFVTCASFRPAPPETAKIKWMTWDEMQAAQKKAPKKVFVDVYTDWCGWCKRMDATTFENPVIVDYMSKNFYAVKFNAEMAGTVNFKGQVFGQEGRYNKLATFLMNNQMSFPTSIYLDEQLNLITTVPGYLDAKQAEPVLNYFATDKYKSVKWDDFQGSFKGKL